MVEEEEAIPRTEAEAVAVEEHPVIVTVADAIRTEEAAVVGIAWGEEEEVVDTATPMAVVVEEVRRMFDYFVMMKRINSNFSFQVAVTMAIVVEVVAATAGENPNLNSLIVNLYMVLRRLTMTKHK